MNTTPDQVAASDYEVDELITELRTWGITYLVGLEPADRFPQIEKDRQSAIILLQRLTQQDDYPRVRDAIISLLLLHPELAEVVQQAIHESDPPIAERIAVLTLAALYLQRLWSIRLAIAFGHPSTFPEQPFASLWQDRHLPSPACHEGACGLLALEEAEQKRTGLPFTFTGDWQNQIKHLLWQEEMQRHHKKIPLATLASLLSEEEQSYEPELCVSMRRGVDKPAIESFLQQLGRSFHKPARLYLVGGAALVHLGIRPGFTQDIGVQVVGPNEGDLIVAIQKLIERLQINIEFASPSDFIPLPS